MRIRARFSITTPSKATATVTVVGAVKALVSIAKEIVAPKATAVVTAGILAASAAYAAPKFSYLEAPKIRAEVSFPVQFMDGATPSDTVSISINKVLLDVSITGDSIDYFTFTKVLNDAVSVSDVLTKVHTKPVDFDQTDADVDPDPAFATDFASFDLTRPDLADSVATSDAAAKDTTKVRQDVATTSDGIDYLVATKILVDTAVPSDVIDSFVLVRPDVADTATTSDTNAKTVTKPDLASAAAATDAAAYHPQTVYTDSVVASDAVDYLDSTKVLADDATVTDVLAKDLIRPDVADTATTSDADAKQVTKPDVADTTTVTDTALLHPKPVYQDTVGTADAIDYLNPTKVLQDTATTSDTLAKDLTRPNVADTALATDDPDFSATKILADGATATDAVNSFTGTKVLADTATTSDANVKSMTAVLADSVTVTDVATANIVPVRFFTEDGTTSDNLVIAEFTTGVDSRSINGYAIDESQFN